MHIMMDNQVTTAFVVVAAAALIIGATARECWEKELRPWARWALNKLRRDKRE